MNGPVKERRNRLRVFVIPPGPCAWEDIGEGLCHRCLTERRLYQPELRSNIGLCANCAVTVATASVNFYQRDHADEFENVPEVEHVPYYEPVESEFGEEEDFGED